MKNSALILGIALLSFLNICNAKNIANFSYNSFQNNILSDDKVEKENDETSKIEKFSLAENVDVFNPETVIANNPKTVKEIIAEDDKIIESVVPNDVEFMEYEESMKEIIAQSDLIIESKVSNETYPLYFERTVEDEIAQLEMVIESNVNNEVRPLEFKQINKAPILINSFNSKKIIGMN
nr:hypothetical protein [uncultured Flavobacterium sp.]